MKPQVTRRKPRKRKQIFGPLLLVSNQPLAKESARYWRMNHSKNKRPGIIAKLKQEDDRRMRNKQVLEDLRRGH